MQSLHVSFKHVSSPLMQLPLCAVQGPPSFASPDAGIQGFLLLDRGFHRCLLTFPTVAAANAADEDEPLLQLPVERQRDIAQALLHYYTRAVLGVAAFPAGPAPASYLPAASAEQLTPGSVATPLRPQDAPHQVRRVMCVCVCVAEVIGPVPLIFVTALALARAPGFVSLCTRGRA